MLRRDNRYGFVMIVADSVRTSNSDHLLLTRPAMSSFLSCLPKGLISCNLNPAWGDWPLGMSQVSLSGAVHVLRMAACELEEGAGSLNPQPSAKSMLSILPSLAKLPYPLGFHENYHTF